MRQGDLVTYTLSLGDAEQINTKRAVNGTSGNRAAAGDVCPALVVRKWSDTTVNLQVFFDGPDTAWLTSRLYGTGDGTWRDYAPVAEPGPAPVDQAAPADGNAQ